MDNEEQVETVVLLSHKSPDSVINVKVDFGEGDDKISLDAIAEVKKALGLTMYDAPNAAEELKQPGKHPPKEKAEAIMEALKHFEVI